MNITLASSLGRVNGILVSASRQVIRRNCHGNIGYRWPLFWQFGAGARSRLTPSSTAYYKKSTIVVYTLYMQTLKEGKQKWIKNCESLVLIIVVCFFPVILVVEVKIVIGKVEPAKGKNRYVRSTASM